MESTILTKEVQSTKVQQRSSKSFCHWWVLRNNQTWHILGKKKSTVISFFIFDFLQMKVFFPPVPTSSLMTRSLLTNPAVFPSGRSQVSDTFQTSPLCLSVTPLPSNRNLQVKTNIWQPVIIGTNWTELYIQTCCLLSTSRHISSLSSGCLALSDICANELFSAACQWQKWENRREVKIVFPFCNYSIKFSN